MSGACDLPAIAGDLQFHARGVTVERNQACRMRDGVVLVADVYRPMAAGTYPVLLMRTPYGRSFAESDFAYAHPSWYSARGYIVVVQDCRGRFDSEGEWYPFRDEADDGYDAIEWAARLSGSTGDVGMYGASYAGMNQLLAAMLQPPSLRAISPALAGSQAYDGWIYNGGAFALAFAYAWAAYLAVDSTRRTGGAATERALDGLREAASRAWALPFRDLPPFEEASVSYWTDWLDHPEYDGYWKRWSIDEAYGRISVPALHIGGWYDIFLSGTVRNFTGLTREDGSPLGASAQRLVLGPWTHGSWIPVSNAGSQGPGPLFVDDLQLEWFDLHLKHRGPATDLVPVTAFVLREGWKSFDSWPPPTSQSVQWFLHSDGRANSSSGDGRLSTDRPAAETPDIYVYDPLAPVPSCGGHSAGVGAPMGPADQSLAQAQHGVLVYTSAPLEQGAVLLGEAEAVLHVSSTAEDSDFVVRLGTVSRDGYAENLQEGILRLRYRESLETTAMAFPGTVYEVTIPLGPVGVRIPHGHRLRVTVTSSDFPQWDRNLNTGGIVGAEGPAAARRATQTIFHDSAHASFVSLPMHGAHPVGSVA